MDLGYSYHMCPNQDYFCTYKPFASGVILVGSQGANKGKKQDDTTDTRVAEEKEKMSC